MLLPQVAWKWLPECVRAAYYHAVLPILGNPQADAALAVAAAAPAEANSAEEAEAGEAGAREQGAELAPAEGPPAKRQKVSGGVHPTPAKLHLGRQHIGGPVQ
jgi:hypothetical protein